jgi:hypothetical protein
MRALALLAVLLLARGAEAQCGADHSSCPQAAATGTELCKPDLALVLDQASRNELGAGGPTYRQIHTGCNKPNPPVNVTATLPCTLTKAVAQTESTWSQFCASACNQSGATLISFDCGYGIMQITSGMGGGAGFDPARVAAEPGYNAATGAKIMMDKWASTPCVGDNRPDIAEDWYAAVWAYNGFGWVNNPNNPNFPATRPPYRGAGTLSRSKYPYQEIVWGYMNHPPTDNGAGRYAALPVSLPDPAQICNTSGCHVTDIPDPLTVHCDECQRGNAATLGAIVAAPAQAPGATGYATVRFTNTGKATWGTGYALVRTGGVSLGADRVPLPEATAPGGVATVALPVSAASVGAYTATFQLQQDPCAFGPAASVTLQVTAAGTTGTTGTTGTSGAVDQDHDGHSGAQDCNDADSTIYVGAPELCDGKDNDCDGQPDNVPGTHTALTRPCAAACGGGVQTCVGAAWGDCVAQGAPSAEVCNGLDDDCNGQVDDGATCPQGQACVKGACVAAKKGCGCSSLDGAGLLALAAVWRARRRPTAPPA